MRNIFKKHGVNSDKGGLAAPMVVAPNAWDGLALDARGQIFTTGEDGVEIYDSEGTKADWVKAPEAVANFLLRRAGGAQPDYEAEDGDGDHQPSKCISLRVKNQSSGLEFII